MDMNRKKFLALAFAVGAVSVMALIASYRALAQPPIPPGAPVNIVNPLPLPVMGSTTVSGSVQVNGTVAVQDIDKPARAPFQIVLCQEASFGGGATGSPCTQPSVQVSTESRLVIEYLSGGVPRHLVL